MDYKEKLKIIREAASRLERARKALLRAERAGAHPAIIAKLKENVGIAAQGFLPLLPDQEKIEEYLTRARKIVDHEES